ncbi:MAG: DinB family protein, partial [Myxococcota bacterium]
MRVEQTPIEDRRRTVRDPRHPGPTWSAARDGLARAYRETRSESLARIAGLSDADATVQSMEDASPAKWHLAHTTWFFETFVLLPASPDHQAFDERFGFLFNSYYEALGERQPRPRRGLLTRPTLQTVLDYRESVDSKVLGLLESEPPSWLQERVELGIQHEQQHQELQLTDILHLFAQNPLRPAFRSLEPGRPPLVPSLPAALDREWIGLPGGIVGIGAGAGAEGFAFDCEQPRHDALIRPFRMASTPVRNREWREFMQEGGYATASLWLADGWEWVKREGWSAPLHWQAQDGDWLQMTLHGLLPIDPE